MISIVRTYPNILPYAYQPYVLQLCLEVSSGLATQSSCSTISTRNIYSTIYTRNSNITCKFVRNAQSWAALQTYYVVSQGI